MAYSGFSTRVSGYLAKELKYNDEQRIILAYALENILQTTLGFVVVVTTGFLIGAGKATLFAALAGGALRKVSGGAHCSTPARCLLVSTVEYSFIGWLSLQLFLMVGNQVLWYTQMILAIFALYMVYLYAPVDSKAKPIVSPSFRKKLRIASFVTVILFSILALVEVRQDIGIAVMLGLTVQGISLLPVFNRKS